MAGLRPGHLAQRAAATLIGVTGTVAGDNSNWRFIRATRVRRANERTNPSMLTAQRVEPNRDSLKGSRDGPVEGRSRSVHRCLDAGQNRLAAGDGVDFGNRQFADRADLVMLVHGVSPSVSIPGAERATPAAADL